MCKDTEKLLTKSEKFFQNGMRSVVAKTKIKKGEIFTIDNVTTKRPFLHESLHAENFFDLLGKNAAKEYEVDDFVGKEEVNIEVRRR